MCPHVRTAPALAVVLVALASVPAAARTGPSTRQEPLLRPLVEGVEIVTILAAGDAVNDRDAADPAAASWPLYRCPGTPQGVVVRDRGDGTFDLVVSHPFWSSQGIVRAHGAAGSVVTRWRVRASDLRVLSGGDLIRRMVAGGEVVPPGPRCGFVSLGSAHLAPPEALVHDDGAGRVVGTFARLVLGGQRTQSSHAWAHVLTGNETGTSYRLDALGCAAPTTVLVCPAVGVRTVAIALDDSGAVARPLRVGPHGPSYPSEIFVYSGEKRRRGNVVERAGLVGGILRAVRVEGSRAEHHTLGLGSKTRVTRARCALIAAAEGGDAAGVSPLRLQNQLIAAGAMQFHRPRGGAWDPTRPGDFWFTTSGTSKKTPQGRLWRLRFEDVAHPERGGSIEIVLEGRDHDLVSPADLAVLPDGTVVFQEAPGESNRVSRIWMLRPGEAAPVAVAGFRPECAAEDVPRAAMQSRGVVDASSILGPGWVLASVQVLDTIGDDEVTAGGQVVAIRLPLR